jgi:hypothetical protein
MIWYVTGGFALFALGFILSCILSSSSRSDMLMCKPLNWQCENGYWFAWTEIGTYRILLNENQHYIIVISGEPVGDSDRGYSSFSKAKAVAQSNHDARVQMRLVNGDYA